jgi:hypothetical protein
MLLIAHCADWEEFDVLIINLKVWLGNHGGNRLKSHSTTNRNSLKPADR